MAAPDFGDLAPDVRASILNWPGMVYGNSFYDDNGRPQFWWTCRAAPTNGTSSKGPAPSRLTEAR